MIRLRKPATPTRLPAEAIMGDPPVYRETLRHLVGRNPSFMASTPVAVPDARWSALDDLLWRAGQQIVDDKRKAAA